MQCLSIKKHQSPSYVCMVICTRVKGGNYNYGGQHNYKCIMTHVDICDHTYVDLGLTPYKTMRSRQPPIQEVLVRRGT